MYTGYKLMPKSHSNWLHGLFRKPNELVRVEAYIKRIW